jgi:aspartate/methionine/tyrosine aminotransferase
MRAPIPKRAVEFEARAQTKLYFDVYSAVKFCIEKAALMTKTQSLQIARRLNEVGFSDIVKIRNRVMELRAEGKQVYEFQGGEPFMNTPEPIKEAMRRALAENKTRYAPSSGIAELREAIAEKLRARNRIPAKVEDVVVMTGGAQGLFAAFQTVLNPGDEVLVFSPHWTPIRDSVAMCEARAVLVPTDEARRDGFIETLSRHLTAKTRAVYYNTPQNPSGVVFTRAEAEATARFIIENNLVCIADEAYEDLIYDGEHVSIASLPGMFERTMTVFTLSKSYSMTGWRIGYTVAPEPFMSGLKRVLLYSTNGVSTPTQYAALAALQIPVSYFDEIRAEYRKRRDLLVGGLNELGLRCPMPAGAFYAFPDVTRISPDSRRAHEILLERAQVATVPGIVFGEHGEGHLRFSFSLAIETIEQGLDSMRRNL